MVSVKQFLKDEYATDERKELLECEKRLLIGMDNYFVVKGLATFRDTNGCNLVMEYATHGDFSRIMIE